MTSWRVLGRTPFVFFDLCLDTSGKAFRAWTDAVIPQEHVQEALPNGNQAELRRHPRVGVHSTD